MKLWKIIGIKVAIFTKNIPADICFFWGHRYLFNGVEHRSRVNFEFLNPHQNSMLNQLYSYELCWLLTKFYIWWFSAFMYKKIYKFDDLYAFNISNDFHFCRSRVIGLNMTENSIFTLCRMITWVVFLRMFWNFISSLPEKILRNTTQVIVRHRICLQTDGQTDMVKPVYPPTTLLREV
jgi:hypothetical protein